MSHRELQELGLLYRQTASDLASVREDVTSAQLAAYLNQLLGRAHNLIYMGHKAKMSGLVRFYRETYPQVFRETLPETTLAFAIFTLAAIAACAVTLRDPAFAHRVLGAKMMETIQRREMWTHSIVTIKPLAASAIMTNNLVVAFAAFAYGVTAGIGTVWMMLFNGIMIGVVGAATWHAGMAEQLWSFVAPHGVLELPSIFIAGGAGLEIARGMLFPGTIAAPRIHRQSRWPRFKAVTRHDSDALCRRNHRGISFAVGHAAMDEIPVRRGNVHRACGLPQYGSQS